MQLDFPPVCCYVPHIYRGTADFGNCRGFVSLPGWVSRMHSCAVTLRFLTRLPD